MIPKSALVAKLLQEFLTKEKEIEKIKESC